jgi:hypothetical protein
MILNVMRVMHGMGWCPWLKASDRGNTGEEQQIV